MKVTALAGGVGGAKLLIGLDRVVPGEDLTAIVNTGDDTKIYGVHVSPDIDIVTYWLADIADTERGWGIKDDTFTIIERLGHLGLDTWFRLGDRDFATCLFRTMRMHEGQPLSNITDEIRRHLEVRPTILPMTDDAVRTSFITTDGDPLDFQEYFVKERHQPDIAEVIFNGIDEAVPAPGVLDSIEAADLVVVCPSNPVVSIGPILGLGGVRDALIGHPRVVAVSPIVRGAALKGPADRLLAAVGTEVSAAGVARLYDDFVDVFVLDQEDVALQTEIEDKSGVTAVAIDTIMSGAAASERVARAIVAL